MNPANAETKPFWQPPQRPEWLATFLDETKYWDAKGVVPLDAAGLIAMAMQQTGLSDFGPDDWREPFEILMRAIEDEAELNFFGRLWTRQDILQCLMNRLLIEETYRQHPEIEDEEIHEPVFVLGLPRSGTSILFELLARDERFMAPANWEFVLPCPPPEAATYRTDPRVPAADHLIRQAGRVTPTLQAMHELGAWIPNECGVAFRMSFRSDHLAATVQAPTYTNWMFAADKEPAYRYYKRLLKLLQWRNPRQHWLLKSPDHQSHLPVLFKVFPDAKVIMTHRDPVRAQGSVTNLLGTYYWMRSDKPFDAKSFEELLTPEGTAARLNQVVDWLEAGTIPETRVAHSLYADLVEDPQGAMEKLYSQLDMPLTDQARTAVAAYLADKPKGKFGAHEYDVNDNDKTRALFARYQARFGVPSE